MSESHIESAQQQHFPLHVERMGSLTVRPGKAKRGIMYIANRVSAKIKLQLCIQRGRERLVNAFRFQRLDGVNRL
ncbi:hypothetical protein E4U54_001329 [Claviceps lovelessii]|nr:hypothetical protein E4U54_001329 [Claviceps lovelessii]